MIARMLLTTLVLSNLSWVLADDLEIRRDLHAFFQTKDINEREMIAARIATHPDYDRKKVSQWLHDARLFKPLKPGRREVTVPLSQAAKQGITLRIPRDYDPKKPWPMLYALHGMGSNGNQIISYFEQILGPMIEEFVVVAPNDYRVSAMRSVRVPRSDHRIILREIRRRVHIDANRQFASGYSMGGHGSWTLAATMPDEFAALMPIAGSFANIHRSYDRELLPNMANTFIATIWGRGDVMNNKGEVSKHGGIAGRNQALAILAHELKLPSLFHEFPNKGHGGVIPPDHILEEVFTKTRQPYPLSVRKTFRSTVHARAYWLEGEDWIGAILDGKSQIILEPRRGEDPRNPEHIERMRERALRSRLGRIEGSIEDQTINIARRKVRTVIIWIGDNMIDWENPITVRLSSRRIYDGTLSPDLFLCLQQVDRTWDLDRLRWSGLRVETGKGVDPIDGRTEFPTLWAEQEEEEEEESHDDPEAPN